MKNRSILSLGSLAVMLMMVAFVSVTGCKKGFDEPATVDTTNLPTPNTTIAQLKALYPTVSGEMKEITEDLVFRAVVVGNDRTGNIFKTIYVQDANSGIEIDIDANGLYNLFPERREVFVKAKGLYIANQANMIKLVSRVVVGGIPTAAPIRQAFMDTYLKRGRLNQHVDTVVITAISQLNNDHQSRLIRLSNFEIASSELNRTYADTSANRATTNINLQNCSGQSIIMRTSGYANFAGRRVPQGNGTVLAIYTVFNTTRQLIIRDTTDLQFTGPRCGSGVPNNLNYITIQQLRALGGGATVPANTGIRGTIVSNTQNEAAGNYRIQDGSGFGIQLRFTANNPNFVLHDSVAVDISGLNVELFNGDMQVNNIGSSVKLGTGTITPRETTVSAVAANVNTWASTVVRLNNVTIVQGSTSTAGTNYTVTDATGNIVTFIRTAMNYTPPAAAASITGYVSIFNGTPQITIRNASDVVAATVTVPTVTTTAITSITQTSASSGGNVTAQGASAVTERGIVWSTSPAPTIANNKVVSGSGTGSFTSAITGLTANTTYYVRAYATNGSGTGYGSEVSFTTLTSTGGSVITENFETGTKTSYAAASVTLSTGSWLFSDAILGGDNSDIKNGTRAARLRGTVGQNNGFIETEFPIAGLKKVTLSHAQTNFFEGTGTLTVSFEVQVSINGGAWTKVGNTVTPTLGTLNTAEFNVNAAAGQNVRVRILNTSGASIQTPTNQVRINIDDVRFEQ